MPLLDVSDLSVAYNRGLSNRADVFAVRDLSFSIERGQRLGLIGKSGSGKSTVLNAIAGLVKPISGSIKYKGNDISIRRNLRILRRETAMLFQSAAVNPKMKILDIVAEPLRNHAKLSSGEEKRRVCELLELTKLSPEYINRYPSELSGGQVQRTGIARALALKPSLFLADEPVTALDAGLRDEILETLRELCAELHIACIFVTHDLSVAREMCDDFLIMKSGGIVESGDKIKIFKNPENEHTKLLISSMF